MTSELPKQYAPEEIENRWRAYWEEKGHAKPSGDGKPYAIVIPPPNVTGTLHMGHGFQYTLMDSLIRLNRMQGKNVLWQVGTDHAGIATQMVVERQLAQENKTRQDLGREAFLERVWQWREQSGSIITNQIRRLGACIDWTRERFTMDEGISKAVNKVFVDFHKEGLIYRGQRLVNWDPKLQTAISDLEVNNKTQQGKMWYFRYPLADSKESIVIATTRPETMLGDTAVAVHPEDERYQHLIGKKIALPLCNRQIPIIADEDVDRDFGTGCVKITPAHDFNDNAMGQKHKLPMISILDKRANINNNAPEAYRGLNRFVARKKILADLDTLGLLEKTVDHELNIPYGDRSDEIIEPLLTDQWFMKMEDLATPAMEAVNTEVLRFIPKNWRKTYMQWLENIQDWCISRQLWWGHRIPAWYDDDNNIYVGMDEADVRNQYQLKDTLNLRQDNDVLDTWFSASLWPFATLGWPEQTADFDNFFPTNVLITGFDIIFFWVARMVMMSLKLTKKIPFHEVYITGLIRDSLGQKMSKSKGNVLDPLDIIDGIELEDLVKKRIINLMQPDMAAKIEKNTRKEYPDGINPHGTDALRFTYCALANTGRDIKFDMGRVEGYRNFCNKIWNASRFVFMQCDGKTIQASNQDSLIDQWIKAEASKTITAVLDGFKQYRFDFIAQAIHEFVWDQYCDWYVELAKCQLLSDTVSDEVKANTRHTLLTVLETVLRLAHPIMPYITEEIWQNVAKQLDLHQETILFASYPKAEDFATNEAALTEVAWLKQIVNTIRNIRGEMNIPPSKKIPLIICKADHTEQETIQNLESFISFLAKTESIDFRSEMDSSEKTAMNLIGKMEIHIPLKGLIDKTAEIERLNKEIKKLEADIKLLSGKLNNPKFVEKAPAAVVEKDTKLCAEFEAKLMILQTTLDNFS